MEACFCSGPLPDVNRSEAEHEGKRTCSVILQTNLQIDILAIRNRCDAGLTRLQHFNLWIQFNWRGFILSIEQWDSDPSLHTFVVKIC